MKSAEINRNRHKRFRNNQFTFALASLAVICAALAGPLSRDTAARENLKAGVQFYIKAYGLSDPAADDRVKRAYEIFEQVRRVADKRGHRIPGLKIVNNLKDPWTIALPDGHIVLSARAVAICYQDTDRVRGDARMAFVLGHELAHLANNDFWHMETFMALSGNQDPWSTRVKNILMEEAEPHLENGGRLAARSKKREMEADDTGFVYAAIAGYPVGMIIHDRLDEKNFFAYWMAQAHTRADPGHPHPMERARLLQARLGRIEEKIAFFQYGVRLAHFGRYEDAVYFLQDFQKTFPSREVLNNLGVCCLKMAVHRMPSARAYEYWLPSVMDFSTRAETLVFREENREADLPGAARDRLWMSVNYLEDACSADTLYAGSRLNLGVARFYLGDIYKARAAVEEALTLEPQNTDAKELRALIIAHEAPDVDMWPHAIKLLKEMAQKKDAPPSVLYNLATLLEKRKRSGEARAVWGELISDPEKIPKVYEASVCRGAGAGNERCLPPERNKDTPLPWPMPINVGADLLKEGAKGSRLKGWEKIGYDWPNKMMRGHIYLSPDGVSILVVNDFVEMVVLGYGDLGTAEALAARCGGPKTRTDVNRGEVWSYGRRWSVLVRDGKVREVWISE